MHKCLKIYRPIYINCSLHIHSLNTDSIIGYIDRQTYIAYVACAFLCVCVCVCRSIKSPQPRYTTKN